MSNFSMMRGRCKKCDYVYDCVALPMPVTEACEVIKHASCPMCGNRKGNLTAASRALTPDEEKAKTTAITMEAFP